MATVELAPGYAAGIDLRAVSADEKEADEKIGLFCPLYKVQLVRG